MKHTSIVEQMQADLKTALKKPRRKRHWAMVVDIRKCVGCHACTVSCKAENKTPEGMDYRSVKEVESGDYPNVIRYFMPLLCMQCDNPPCVTACESKAISKGEDGVVRVDYSACTGCNKPSACPYDVLFKDKGNFYTKNSPKFEPYETADTFEYGHRAGRDEKIGKCRKCHYCLHRVEAGMLPACVVTCIGEANYFGDLNDPHSLVAKKAKEPGVYIMQASLGTKPTTRYLGAKEYNCAECHD